MDTDTPIDALTRALAQHLESSDSKGVSKAAQKKTFHDKLKQLQPLRAAARPGEIENVYVVAAWYSLFPVNPPVLPQQHADPNDIAIVASSRSVIALTNLSKAWKERTALSKIRQALRGQLPLPSWPGRDFLETLCKISNTGYKVNTLLKELPQFLHTRLQKLPDPRYFKREGRRCVIRSELEEFYKVVVEPSILGSLPINHPRKRRRTDANVRRIRANGQDEGEDENEDENEDVELPRRASVREHEEERTILEPSPIPPSIDSIEQPVGSQARHSEVSPNSLGRHIEDFELDISNEQTFLNEEPAQQTFIDGTDSVVFQPDEHGSFNADNSAMARKHKTPVPTPEAQAQKEVDDRFHDLEEHACGMNPAVQWLLDTAARRESLKTRIESANTALDSANNALAQLEDDISSKLPPGADLERAISDAEDDLDHFETLYDKAVAQQRATEALYDELRAANLRFLVAQTLVDESAATAERTIKEQRIDELNSLAAEFEERKKSQENKEEELESLNEDLRRVNASVEYTKALFNMRTDIPTGAALAARQNSTGE